MDQGRLLVSSVLILASRVSSLSPLHCRPFGPSLALFPSFRGPKGPAYGGERGTEEGMIGSERNWHAIPRVKRRQEREPDGRAVTVTGVGSGGDGVTREGAERGSKGQQK